MSESELDRLLVMLDETFAVVSRSARGVVRQLHSWTGGFSASASGAPPAPAGGEPARDDDSEEDASKSKELDGDAAGRKIERLFALVDELVVVLGDTGDALGGEVLPHPPRRLESRLAFITWQINKLRRSSRRPPLGRVKHAVRIVFELESICSAYAPPASGVAGVPAGGCIAHARAGEWQAIDDRYRKHDLCRRCGDFKHLFSQLPPPKLVSWAEKHGWRSATTSANLTRFGVKGRPAGKRAVS